MMGEWSEDIEALERVMEVYEELGGENESRLSDLVTPFRRLSRVVDAEVKIAPFSANKRKPCRIYVFEDLILLGTSCSSSSSSGDQGASKLGWLNSLRKRTSSRRLSRSLSSRRRSNMSSTSSTMSSSSSTNSFMLDQRLNLSHCSIKSSSSNNDEFGFQLKHVYREYLPNTNRPATRIDMVELYFGGDEELKRVGQELEGEIALLIEKIQEERYNEFVQGEEQQGEKDISKPRARSWAKSKGSLRKTNSSNRLQRVDSEASGDSASVTSATSSVTGLSLADLESRYQVDFNTDEQAEFDVVFGEGALGLSLSSSNGLGVIVGKVGYDSLAEFGGVEVGDRVIAIQDEKVTEATTWREAVAIIKRMERPLTIRFLRNFKVNSNNNKENAIPKKRSWANKKLQRTQSFGARIISIAELEKMYKQEDNASGGGSGGNSIEDMFTRLGKSPNEHERACASVLKEILDTERGYVCDLRTVIGDYILPLRRTVRRVRCKDQKQGSTFCEHKTLRMTCKRSSSDSRPILEAQDVNDIFMNIETILKVNTELLNFLQTGLQKTLDDKQQNTGIVDIVRVFAPAFVRTMPFFKMYSLYCHNYTFAIDKLLVCRTKNKELHAMLKQRESRSDTTLQSLLILPIQRICKYPLLFKSLLKNIVPYVTNQVDSGNTSLDELDKLVGELEKALHIVDRVAHDVNLKVGEQESLEKMMEIYAELGGENAVPNLIAPSRRYLSTFDVFVKMPPLTPDNTELLDQSIYVFNDHLVFTEDANFSSNNNNHLSRSASFTSQASNKSSLSEKAAATMKQMLWSSSSSSNTEKKRGSDGSSSTSSLHSRSNNNNGSHRSKNRSGGVLKFASSVIRRLDMRQCQVKSIDETEDDYHGIILTFITRTSSSTANTGTSDTLQTNVEKIQLWLHSKQTRDALYHMLASQIKILADQDANLKQISNKVGHSDNKKTRSWKTKTQHKSQRLKQKYATIKNSAAANQ